MSRQELTDAIAAVLDEASELEQARHRLLLTPPPNVGAALEEVGLPPEMLSEGQRARHEAAERDRRAVRQRYQRWFPQPPSTASEESADDEQEEAAAVLVLSTVAEVISELGGEPLMRKADAIDVLERLLPDAQLAPGQYRALVSQPTPRVAQALQAVNALTDG